MANWSEREIEAAIEATFTKFGYPAASPEQMEAVKEFVKGKDVFVSTPTGSGKSLCYGCLPLVFDSLRSGGKQEAIVVVVSPLKALMLDQVQAFTAKGVSCAYVGAQDSDSGSLHDLVEKGEFSLVFISPESLVSGCRWREMFRSAVYQANLVGVVVDEAHCIDKW